MTHLPTPAMMDELLACAHGPCLSLYQQTLNRPSDPHQNPNRFVELAHDLQRLLELHYPHAHIPRLMAPFVALGHDEDFWRQTDAGLAVLGGTNLIRVFVLPYAVPDLTVVGSRFHVLPLVRPVEHPGAEVIPFWVSRRAEPQVYRGVERRGPRAQRHSHAG